MPPRANLDEYERYLRYDGQVLQLNNIETRTTGDNVYPEQMYTFTRVNPDLVNNIQDIPEVNLELPYEEINRILGRYTLRDFDGDTDLENVNIADHITTDNLNNTLHYDAAIVNASAWQPSTTKLTDEFKELLKPFIQEVLKEMLENEGFILGRLPGDE